MQWYYADAGRQVGPLDDAAFDELVKNGTVRDDTPVWKEGMADWQPYSMVRPPKPVAHAPVAPAPPPPAAAPVVPETGFCTQCGGRFPKDQLGQVRNRQMCGGSRAASAPAPAPAQPAYTPPASSGPSYQSPHPSSPHPSAQPQYGSAIPAATPLTQFATPAAGDYATWANRAIGYIIDSIFVGIAMAIIAFILSLVAGSIAGLGSLGGGDAGGALAAIGGGGMCCTLAAIPLAMLAVGLYNKVYLLSKRGFSIGQGVMKVKIVDAAGNKLTMNTAIIRLLAQIGLAIVPFGAALDLLWPLWDAQRQTLHDKAVGSFAINNPSGQ